MAKTPGLKCSVGLFIDGVYRSRTGVGLCELGDIERVEVLRGPQGTLFGRNSTAGLINIVTKGPELGEFSGKGSISYGNYDYLRVDGAINAPLGDIAARADRCRLAEARWLPRKRHRRTSPTSTTATAGCCAARSLFEPSDDDQAPADRRLQPAPRKLLRRDAAQPGPQPLAQARRLPGWHSANTLLPLLQAFGANFQVAPNDETFVRAQSTTPGVTYRSDSEDWGVSGELNWNLGAATLTSITAYRDYHNEQGQDSDFQAMDILHRTDLDREFKLFTQELRLQGEALDGRLDWLVGGYYANEKLFVDDDIVYGSDYERYANCLAATALSAANVNPGFGNLLEPANSPASRVSRGLPRLTNSARLNGTGNRGSTFNQDSENYAFFTHNTFDIIEDRLIADAGCALHA